MSSVSVKASWMHGAVQSWQCELATRVSSYGNVSKGKTDDHVAQLLAPFVDSIFSLLQIIHSDQNRTEALLRASMGVIGDLSEAFPNGEYSSYFRAEFLTAMARETRANKEYSPRTIETARWAREQIKRQTGAAGGVTMAS